MNPDVYIKYGGVHASLILIIDMYVLSFQVVLAHHACMNGSRILEVLKMGLMHA